MSNDNSLSLPELNDRIAAAEQVMFKQTAQPPEAAPA
jgi:hypothetical protein